jgi:proteic killer suppression protein
MIRSFRHKGLKRFYETGSTSGILASHAKRLSAIFALEAARAVENLQFTLFRLHALKGDQRGRWSVWVNGNWRVTFEFHGSDAHVLDYEDYH